MTKDRFAIIVFLLLACICGFFSYFFAKDGSFFSLWKDESKNGVLKNAPKEQMVRYFITIDPIDYKKMQQKLPQQYIDDRTIMEKRDQIEVPAELRIDDKTYDVEIRYRGDVGNHWRYEKKSFKIKLVDGLFPDGTKSKKLFIPQDRGYLIESTNNARASLLGLVVPRSDFVNLSINDNDQGVYYEIEPWEKPLLERNGKSSATSILGEDFPQSQHEYFMGTNFFGGGIAFSDAFYSSHAYSTPLYRLIEETKKKPEDFRESIFSIIDKEKFYLWNSNAILSSSSHQASGWNERWYFDPTSGLLEPFPWDTFLYSTILNEHKAKDEPPYRLQAPLGILVEKILVEHPDFLQERNAVLWDIVKDNTILDQTLKHYKMIEDRYGAALIEDALSTQGEKETRQSIEDSEALFREIYVFVRDQLNSLHTTLVREESSLRLRSYSLVDFTMKIDENFRYCLLNTEDAEFKVTASIDKNFYPTLREREIMIKEGCRNQSVAYYATNLITGQESNITISSR